MNETTITDPSPMASIHRGHPRLSQKEGEGDWVSYWRLFWRHRRGLVLSGVLSALVGGGGAFLVPKVYMARSILEIDPQFTLGDSPEPLRLKIEEVYFASVLNDLGITTPKYPTVSASIPRGMKIVKVSVQSNHPGESLQILQKVVEHAVSNQEEKVASLRRDWETNLHKKEGEEKNLLFQSQMNDKKWEIEKQTLASALQVKNLDLKTLGEKIDLAKRQKGLLVKDREMLEKQMAISGDRLQDLLKNKDRLNIKGRDKDLLSVLHFSDEIQANQKYHDSMEQKLTSSLEGKEIDLTASLADLNARYDKLKIEIQEDQLSQDRRRLVYENSRADFERQRSDIRLDIQSLRKTLENAHPLSILVPPTEKKSPVWPSKSRMAILAGGAGFALAALFLLGRAKIASLG